MYAGVAVWVSDNGIVHISEVTPRQWFDLCFVRLIVFYKSSHNSSSSSSSSSSTYWDGCPFAGLSHVIIIIIIIERKDLGGVMSKDCKDTLQTLKTVTKRECDAK